MKHSNTRHSTAIVEAEAHVGRNVHVGPFCYIASGSVIGEDSRLESHAVVLRGSVVGRDAILGSFTVVGGDAGRPAGEGHNPGRVDLGRAVVLRDGATVAASTDSRHPTWVGPHSLLMANSHVGSDCRIGARVIVAANATLATCVEVGDFTVVGAGSAIQRAVRLGEGSIVGANAEISADVPPFAITGHRNTLLGINTAGLRQRGVRAQTIADLVACYREVLSSRSDPEQRARELLRRRTHETRETLCFLRFFEAAGLGICLPANRSATMRRSPTTKRVASA